MTRRPFFLVTAVAVFAVAVLGAGHAPHSVGAATAPHPAVQTFRVVGTGDSILGMSFGLAAPGGTYTAAGRWIDVEYGRNAWSSGMQSRASTASIWPTVLTRSQPNGWVVISDNGLGTSDAGWLRLMNQIVDELPNDRCLLGVLPGFRADLNAQRATEIARRAQVMAATFAGQPCHAFVYLNAYVRDHPSSFPDGQHPDATGQRWLRGSVLAWTG